MVSRYYSNRRYSRGMATVLIGIGLTVLVLVPAGGGIGATPDDPSTSYQDGVSHMGAHGTVGAPLMHNLEPPPPPGAPADSVAAWKAKETTGVQSELFALAAAAPTATTGGGVSPSATARTLILYDTTGEYSFLGEQYAIGAANLSSHFGNWTAKPVASYTTGDITDYTAAIYLGTTFDEPLPAAFLDDVLVTTKPVLWSYDNIWQLTNRAPATFEGRYGWNAAQSSFDPRSTSAATPVSMVRYKGKGLTRNGVDNLSGIFNPTITDPTKVQVLATAVRSDGTTFPWAIRSANLTYIGEIPLTYMNEDSAVLAFADLLFDLYGQQQVHHRAMVRLEDISAKDNPATLMAIADYLSAQGVPFGFGVTPIYRDPLGYFSGKNCTPGVPCGPAQVLRLKDAQVQALVNAIKYLEAHGGTMVEHGYTHQWDGGINPYIGVTDADFEFYRVVENADKTLSFAGPVPEDSVAWATDRIAAAADEFTEAGLPVPTLFEFPHYYGSAADYQAVADHFEARWERSVYFNGLLSGRPIAYNRVFGQLFPFAVRDVYGTIVLPEDLGNISAVPFFQFAQRLPSDVIHAADLNLIVRDGVASFYFHPFLYIGADGKPTTYLQETVAGIKALGYTFVGPTSVMPMRKSPGHEG